MSRHLRVVCLLTALLLALAGIRVGAQSASISASLSSATCPGSGCVSLPVSGVGGIGVQVTGTFTGTLTFEGTLDGQTYVALNLTAINGTTPATTTTSTGIFTGGVGGLGIVRVRMSAYTSGTAVVRLQMAPTTARSGGGGVTYPLLGTDGTTANPTYSFANAPGTGFYYKGASIAAIAVNGSDQFVFAANIFQSPWQQVTNGTQYLGTAFGSLGTGLGNGTILYCTDCTIANPCAGGGTGALAKRLNGAWVCN